MRTHTTSYPLLQSVARADLPVLRATCALLCLVIVALLPTGFFLLLCIGSVVFAALAIRRATGALRAVAMVRLCRSVALDAMLVALALVCSVYFNDVLPVIADGPKWTRAAILLLRSGSIIAARYCVFRRFLARALYGKSIAMMAPRGHPISLRESVVWASLLLSLLFLLLSPVLSPLSDGAIIDVLVREMLP